MEAIGQYLGTFPRRIKGKKTNKFFLLADEISQLTGDPPLRWVREVKLHPWAAGVAACRTWLRIIHCSILHAVTIPEVITLVLHPAFRRAAVVEGFRNSP